MKKIFIKICKLLGFEILDQNKFSSPTLEKELNDELGPELKKQILKKATLYKKQSKENKKN